MLSVCWYRIFECIFLFSTVLKDCCDCFNQFVNATVIQNPPKSVPFHRPLIKVISIIWTWWRVLAFSFQYCNSNKCQGCADYCGLWWILMWEWIVWIVNIQTYSMSGDPLLSTHSSSSAWSACLIIRNKCLVYS